MSRKKKKSACVIHRLSSARTLSRLRGRDGAHLQRRPVKLGAQNIVDGHPRVDLSQFVQRHDALVGSLFHLKAHASVRAPHPGQNRVAVAPTVCYLSVPEGELALPALQRSVVHPLFDQSCAARAGLLGPIVAEVVRR